MIRKLLSFDEMKDMAANDPEAFEAYRQEIIDGFIANLPLERHERARKEQWRIDMLTRKVKDPLVRLEIVYHEMLQAFINLNHKLNHDVADDPRPKAPVLSFEAAQKTRKKEA